MEEAGNDSEFMQSFFTEERFNELYRLLEFYAEQNERGRPSFVLKHMKLQGKYFFRQLMVTKITHEELIDVRAAILGGAGGGVEE